MISATAPIYVSLLGRIFLKESCGLFEVVLTTVIMGGVLIVMQPPMLFHQGEEEAEGGGHGNKYLMNALVALLGTVFSAGAMVASRALKVLPIFFFIDITLQEQAVHNCYNHPSHPRFPPQRYPWFRKSLAHTKPLP